MPRPRQQQLRLGAKEKKLLADARRHLKAYKVFWSQRNEAETQFNKRVIDWLRQKSIHVRNSSIPTATVAGEVFRPECFYKHGDSTNLFAIECKRLSETHAKARWKEGLSQALLYTSVYKYVFLVLFDFTPTKSYVRSFGPGNGTASRFAAQLREKYNVEIIVVPHHVDPH